MFGAEGSVRAVEFVEISCGGGVIRELCASIRFQCESIEFCTSGRNMAMSLHDGPANQLDLLIRAGKKTKALAQPRQRGFVWGARAAALRSVKLCCKVMEGISGSDHLGWQPAWRCLIFLSAFLEC